MYDIHFRSNRFQQFMKQCNHWPKLFLKSDKSASYHLQIIVLFHASIHSQKDYLTLSHWNLRGNWTGYPTLYSCHGLLLNQVYFLKIAQHAESIYLCNKAPEHRQGYHHLLTSVIILCCIPVGNHQKLKRPSSQA